MLLEYKKYLRDDHEHNLAGVVVIYKNKILLVKPKKFKVKMRKWSIPKGHIENNSIIQTALDELREETSLRITPDVLRASLTDKVTYFKNGVKKDLNYFVVKIKKKDLDMKLFNNMILGNFLPKGETSEAGFFSKEDAKELIETNQRGLLKYLK
jgi:8-oxo-dGTP pyrophosphatase MutT (NUDIX family)